MNIYESSHQMVSELITELSDSTFIDGGLRLDLVYDCCDLSIEHSIAVRNLFEMGLTLSLIHISEPTRPY